MIFGAIYSLSETPESNSFYIGRTGSESFNVEISALRAEETKLRAIPRSPVSIFDPPNPEEQRLWEIRDRLTALRQDAASP